VLKVHSLSALVYFSFAAPASFEARRQPRGSTSKALWLHSPHQNSLETKSAYPSTGGNHTLIEQKIGQRESVRISNKAGCRSKRSVKNKNIKTGASQINLNAMNKRPMRGLCASVVNDDY
jgi:hypothetical protein